jgi:plastocyanin
MSVGRGLRLVGALALLLAGLVHSLLAADRSFSSASLGRGDTFQFTFDAPGEFAYLCGIHPEMTGTVTVTD